MPPSDIGDQPDLPVLALGISTHAQFRRLRRVRTDLANCDRCDVAFPLSGQGRLTKKVPCSYFWGGSSVAGLRCPSHGRLGQFRFANRPSAEGRSNWLDFLRKIRSFSIPNRFIPAHPVTCKLPQTTRHASSLHESHSLYSYIESQCGNMFDHSQTCCHLLRRRQKQHDRT